MQYFSNMLKHDGHFFFFFGDGGMDLHVRVEEWRTRLWYKNISTAGSQNAAPCQTEEFEDSRRLAPEWDSLQLCHMAAVWSMIYSKQESIQIVEQDVLKVRVCALKR